MITNNKNNIVVWLDYLPHNVYMRLVQYKTIKEELSILLDAKWQWAQNEGRYNSYTKDDMLVDILDLLDCNGLEIVTELTIEEWRNLTR